MYELANWTPGPYANAIDKKFLALPLVISPAQIRNQQACVYRQAY